MSSWLVSCWPASLHSPITCPTLGICQLSVLCMTFANVRKATVQEGERAQSVLHVHQVQRGMGSVIFLAMNLKMTSVCILACQLQALMQKLVCFYQWLAHYYWKARGIHNPSAKHTSEVLLSLILSRRELSHGRSHFPKPIRRVVTESELKRPGFHPLKCCCCLLSTSFLLSSALQISLALCFLLLWCSLSQRCKAVVSPSTYYLIFYLGCIDSFQSLAQSKAIIVQLPVYWELKL